MRDKLEITYENYLDVNADLEWLRTKYGEKLHTTITNLLPYFRIKDTSDELTLYRIAAHTKNYPSLVKRHYEAYQRASKR
jgi:methyl coenzyme M reductase alpha subunit